MNHVSLIGHLPDAPTYTAPTAGGPARAAFTVGLARRGSSAVDWIGGTAVGAQADALAAADLGAGAVVALHIQPLKGRQPTPRAHP